MNEIYHIPAMLRETIQGLNIQPDGLYVDVTFGGGGHSRAILQQLSEQGKLYSFDQDVDTLQNAMHQDNWQFVHSNFRYLRNFMDYYGVKQIDGLQMGMMEIGRKRRNLPQLDGPLRQITCLIVKHLLIVVFIVLPRIEVL